MCKFCGQDAGYRRREAIFEVMECRRCGAEFRGELEGRLAALRKAIDRAILKIDVDQPDVASLILQEALQVSAAKPDLDLVVAKSSVPELLQDALEGVPLASLPNTAELILQDRAAREILTNANAFVNRKPKLRTLLAELAELAYALDGDHEHTPEFELIEIGGIAINMLRQRYAALEEAHV